MAEVRPFRGLRYMPGLVGDLGLVVCPPYDIISESQQAELHARSPYNAVRLELAEIREQERSSNAYTMAAENFFSWQEQGILVQDQEPCLYLLEETYSSNQTRKRHCLFAAVRLEDLTTGMILPHEQTRRGPKLDRLQLMEACGANFSPVMALYRDPGDIHTILSTIAETRQPNIVTKIATTMYRLWAISDPHLLESLHAQLEPINLYLADGHHRYETALTYRQLEREKQGITWSSGTDLAYEYILMGLIEITDPGLSLEGYHRILSGLSGLELEQLWDRLAELFTDNPDRTNSTPSFTVIDGSSNSQTTLTLRRDLPPGTIPTSSVHSLIRCEPWLLHELILQPMFGGNLEMVSYSHDIGDVTQRITSKESQIAFVLPPIQLETFESVVLERKRLPPKSTYFTPKLPTGFVIHNLTG
jgi:uncharacterized protein (DUF1015 family)